MSEIRYTQEGQDQRKEHLKAMQERLENVREIVGLEQDPKWKKLKAVLDGNIEFEKRTQRRLSADAVNLEKSDAEVRRELANSRVREEGYAFVIDLVEKRESQIGHLKKEIGSIEDQIKEAAEQLR